MELRLFLSPFVVKHRYSLSANLTLFRCAPTDADIRIGRRRCPYRSTQMSASVDADGKRNASMSLKHIKCMA